MGLFSTKTTFHPDSDIPDLTGKVILVTGGNTGLGKETLVQFAKHHPAKLYMGARSESKAKASIADIKKIVPEANIHFLKLDVSSFASVKAAAEEFLSQNDRLDVLVNNAGIMGVTPGLTEDGYEIHFGTNHMGPALLTKLLLPKLSSTAKRPETTVRIVNISSALYSWAPKSGIPLDQMKTDMKGVGTMELYGQTKLANIFHAKSLSARYPDITSVSLHPGIVKTNIISSDIKSSQPIFTWAVSVLGLVAAVDVTTGALNQLWASVSKDVKNGAFYYPIGKETAGNTLMNSKSSAEELWQWTEEQFSAKGY
jgi:NAD(P)-dependent dehydrogenase (short-subunit alcohol dehydrogenase family)